VPAGDAAKGYMAATWNVAGKDVPVIADIEKVVYGAGKGNMQDKNKLGSVLYNRGVSAAMPPSKRSARRRRSSARARS
jgi:branched-chain amino acid transport system substrate-binding protein